MGSEMCIRDRMIYDGIKASLPSYLARHILSLETPLSESGGWLGRQGLIDALDAYVAMSVPPKPVNGALERYGHKTSQPRFFWWQNILLPRDI